MIYVGHNNHVGVANSPLVGPAILKITCQVHHYRTSCDRSVGAWFSKPCFIYCGCMNDTTLVLGIWMAIIIMRLTSFAIR